MLRVAIEIKVCQFGTLRFSCGSAGVQNYSRVISLCLLNVRMGAPLQGGIEENYLS